MSDKATHFEDDETGHDPTDFASEGIEAFLLYWFAGLTAVPRCAAQATPFAQIFNGTEAIRAFQSTLEDAAIDVCEITGGQSGTSAMLLR